MKIVHLVLGGAVAGGQLVALQLARAAREHGHEAAVISPSRGELLELLADEEVPAHVVEIRGALDVAAALRLAALLRRERADVLHTHGHFAVNVVGRAAGRIAGVPVVAHMHIENVFRPQPFAAVLQRLLDNATARTCARILAVSEETRRSLVRQGYPAELVEVVHNGIELAARGDGAADLPPGPLVVHVGRLCEVKGQREVIRALPKLDATAVLVGEDLEAGGAFRRSLESEAAALGVSDRVVFAGYRRDVPAILERADVVVLASAVEGLPLVLLEAMVHRKPVVATRVGGTPEVVADGVTGLLVPPHDPDALASAIGRLLADADLARTLGEAGRRRVEERFSAAAMTRRVLEVYDEVARTMQR